MEQTRLEREIIRGRQGHSDQADDYVIVAFYEPGWRGRALNTIMPLDLMPFTAIWQESDYEIRRPVWFIKARIRLTAPAH